MKTTKRILAVLLAVMMVAAMMVAPASAAGTAKITINGTHEGATYTLYKLLDLSTDGTNYSYKTTAEWDSFFATGDGSSFVTYAGGYVTWNTGNAADLAALAGAAIPGKTVYGTYTVGTGSTSITIDTLDPGYYLIKSSMGTLFGVATAQDGNTRTITEKTGLPNINKAVDQATHSIGDEVTFTVTLNVETGGTNYIIHDQWEAGFTYKEIVSVKYAGTALAADKYTVNQTGVNLTIEFEDSIGYETGKAIVVEYKLVLNKDAEIATNVNQNTVWLTHGATNVSVAGNTVDVNTYKFDLVKTKESGEVLDGAKFKLYANNEVTEIPVVKVSEGVYRLAVSGETGVEIETKNGVATIQGVGNGTYKLKEIAAPTGYNEIATMEEITINGANKTATVTGSTYETGGVQIINKTGTLLPETGGIGTTIFYVLGGVLVLGAVVVLAVKRRKNAQ